MTSRADQVVANLSTATLRRELMKRLAAALLPAGVRSRRGDARRGGRRQARSLDICVRRHGARQRPRSSCSPTGTVGGCSTAAIREGDDTDRIMLALADQAGLTRSTYLITHALPRRSTSAASRALVEAHPGWRRSIDHGPSVEPKVSRSGVPGRPTRSSMERRSTWSPAGRQNSRSPASIGGS